MEKQTTEKGRDGRMDKQKGRDGRKDKQKGREEEDITAAGHQFFKVIVPEQSEERLKIPQPFLEYLEEEPNQEREVSLKGPSGNTWKVVLTWDCEGLGFTKGWKEFASHLSLVWGHFLVFTYDGRSQFSVAVFCASGVKDKLALDVQPCEAVVKIEEEEHVVDVDVAGLLEESAPPEGNGTLRKRVRQINDVMENGPAFF